MNSNATHVTYYTYNLHKLLIKRIRNSIIVCRRKIKLCWGNFTHNKLKLSPWVNKLEKVKNFIKVLKKDDPVQKMRLCHGNWKKNDYMA